MDGAFTGVNKKSSIDKCGNSWSTRCICAQLGRRVAYPRRDWTNFLIPNLSNTDSVEILLPISLNFTRYKNHLVFVTYKLQDFYKFLRKIFCLFGKMTFNTRVNNGFEKNFSPA